MQTTIPITIDDSILLSLKKKKEVIAREMRFNYALALYRQHQLSLGKAAELAGYSRLDFIDKLRLEGEFIFDYEPELVKEMIATADEILPSLERESK